MSEIRKERQERKEKKVRVPLRAHSAWPNSNFSQSFSHMTTGSVQWYKWPSPQNARSVKKYRCWLLLTGQRPTDQGLATGIGRRPNGIGRSQRDPWLYVGVMRCGGLDWSDFEKQGEARVRLFLDLVKFGGDSRKTNDEFGKMDMRLSRCAILRRFRVFQRRRKITPPAEERRRAAKMILGRPKFLI